MKVVIVVSSIFCLGVVSAGLAKNSKRLKVIGIDDSVCKQQVYADALNCVQHGYEKGAEARNSCMSNIVVAYLKCTEPPLDEKLAIEGRLGESAGNSTELGKLSLIDIKCIVDNVLDLVKCVVDGELKPAVPFIWDWIVFVTCIGGNITKYVECFPKK